MSRFTLPRAALRTVLGTGLVGLLAACSSAAPATVAPTSPGTTTAAATAPPAATTRPTAGPAIRAAAKAMWGDWQADEPDAIPGLGVVGPAIQLSVDWQGGMGVWVQTQNGDIVAGSRSVEADAGQLRLIAEGAPGCAAGDLGTYTWERSTNGLFLTLTATEDACAARKAMLNRTWVHSLSAVNDGGLGILRFGDFVLQAALPKIRFAMSGGQDAPDIHSFDESDPRISLIVVRNPMGVDSPCGATRTAVEIERTAAAFGEHVDGLPGVSVKTTAVEIDGHAALHITATSNPDIDCARGEIALMRAMDGSPDAEWSFAPGEAQSLWVVEIGASTLLLSYSGEGVTAADEQAVIDSIRLLPGLPTP